MHEKFLRIYRSMELEEKVVHVGAIICLLGLFVPWITRDNAGQVDQWGAFGFYTGFIGHAIFLCLLIIVFSSLSSHLAVPAFIRIVRRYGVRFFLSGMNTILLVACFSILLRITSQIVGTEIRFGIYVSIAGSALTTLYSFLQFDEQKKSEVRELFHHPDRQVVTKKSTDTFQQDGLPPLPLPLPPSRLKIIPSFNNDYTRTYHCC